jgi:hypothetical protein
MEWQWHQGMSKMAQQFFAVSRDTKIEWWCDGDVVCRNFREPDRSS